MRRKIFLGLIALGLVAGSVFYACKKDSSSEVDNQYLKTVTNPPDTVYVAACAGCTSIPNCTGNPAGCLPEFEKKGSLHDRSIFADLIAADDDVDGNDIKINIISQNLAFFAQFISAEWLDRIEKGTCFVSCIQSGTERYIFSFRFINAAGGTTYFAWDTDGSIVTDAQYLPITLMDEDDE